MPGSHVAGYLKFLFFASWRMVARVDLPTGHVAQID